MGIIFFRSGVSFALVRWDFHPRIFDQIFGISFEQMVSLAANPVIQGHSFVADFFN